MHLSRLASLLVCLLVSPFVAAQEPWLDAPFTSKPADLLAAAAKIDAGKANVVVLYDDTRIQFDEEGKATRTYYMVYRVVNDQGARGWDAISAHYEPWREHKPVVRARVITRDGTVHVLDPATLGDAPVRGDTPSIYTDDRRLRGPLPAVAAGVVVEQEVSVSESRPMLEFGQIYRTRFGAGVPTHASRLLVEAPTRIAVRHSVQLLPGLRLERSETAGRLTLTFTHARLEALESAEPYTPGDVATYPHVDISTGASWQALATAYSRIVDEKIKDADVAAFTDKAKSAKSREARITSLIRQLHETVRYTGVEFGESSIIPQPPAETLKRKYGDCKDKSTLLVAMLRQSGIPAHLALLLTGPGPDSPPDLPGLGRFDHAIVYIPGSPDYWVDATAEFSRLEQFPPADQGRLALIVSPGSTALVKTPELPASANRLVQVRDVYLAERGPARFVETNLPSGPMESAYRAYYQEGDVKERRQRLEAYVKHEYASDRLLRFENSNSRDFSKPFQLTLESTEARRGYTTLWTADVYIIIASILNRLPQDLTRDPADEEGQEEKPISERSKKKRQHDFVFDSPFVTEWQYRIHPPVGFAVRAVPQDQVERFGPATLTTRFSRDLQNGVLHGTFIFDSGKRRWTAAEVEEFREALTKWKKTDNPHVGFSLKGTMLLEAGKLKEGVDALKSLSALHPQEAIHHIQMAYSLLNAGLGEGARTEARRALELEPGSAEAHRALGWILQHDLVGRRFRKGFDLAGAVAAYRKALELDPKNNEIRIDYAILLEHDASGIRYSKRAALADALKEYQAVGDKLSEYGSVDNPLYLRLHMERFDELLAELGKLQKTDSRRSLQIAALAASQGTSAAIAEGYKLPLQGGGRTRVMASASSQLVSLRRYTEAADLLAAAVEGSEQAATESGRAQMLRAVQRFDPATLDRSDPGNVMKRMLALMMDDGEFGDDVVLAFTLPEALSPDPVRRQKSLRRSRDTILQARGSFRKSGMELPVLRDIAMTLAQQATDFDGVNTYRVRYDFPGADAQTVFVTRRDANLYITGGSQEFSGLAHEALRRLAAGDLESVRKLFDWVREELKVKGGEDPLAGEVFPRLWTRGQQVTMPEARRIAAVLLAESDRFDLAIPILEDALRSGVPDAQRPFIQLALAHAYLKGDRFADLSRVAADLRKQYPESLTAFELSTQAFHALGDFSAWEALAQDRLQRLRDDVDAIRSLSHAAAARGDVRKSIAQRARLVEIGKATVSDYNSLSWDELFDGNITAKGLEYGHKGNMQSKSEDAPLLHTLAAVYAEVGKIAEAREMILKAMDQWNLDEPNSTSWYVFGRIAEQYGMTEDAVAAYKKVERPDHDWQIPNSTYQLAERRLKVIAAAVPSAPAKAPAKPASRSASNAASAKTAK